MMIIHFFANFFKSAKLNYAKKQQLLPRVPEKKAFSPPVAASLSCLYAVHEVAGYSARSADYYYYSQRQAPYTVYPTHNHPPTNTRLFPE